MSARIAPEPVNTAISTTADFRPRSALGDQQTIPRSVSGNETLAASQYGQTQESRHGDVLPPLPAPPDPPGTMFAAAVMAGALPPKPETPEELFLRLGGSWSPPDSDLRLADRKI
jgi:hypothetical protein